MAVASSSSSRMYSASEVLAILDDQEDFEAELGELVSAVDLDGESDDGDEAQGDGSQEDGSQILLDTEVLAPDSASLIALTLNSPSPAERDSMLLLDPELNRGTKIMTWCPKCETHLCIGKCFELYHTRVKYKQY